MSLLDFIVIAAVLLIVHLAPQVAFISVLFVVVLALIIERVIRGERL